MPMDPGEIERMIKEALPDAEVKLEDLVGDGDHWSATVISSIDLLGPTGPSWG